MAVMTPKVTVDIGLPGSVKQNILAAMEEKLRAAAHEVVSDAQARAPVKTGTLRRSIRLLRVERDGDRIVVRLGSDVPHAAVVELGTHTMAPQSFLRRALYSTAWRRLIGDK